MKITPVLFKQHFGRLIRWNWFVQGRLKPVPTPTEEILKSYGYETVDIKEVLFPKQPREKITVLGMYDREPLKDENHPDYKREPCFFYKNEDILLEGLKQAQVLTNTVVMSDDLPQSLLENEKKMELDEEVHKEIKRKILLSCLLEASQEKLPKRKDPNRPAWIFPRDYGIVNSLKNELLCRNLLTVCEQVSKERTEKSVVMNALFSAPVEAYSKKMKFEMVSEVAVTGSNKMAPLEKPSATKTFSLPDITPLHCTVSLKPEHFYDMQNIYPIDLNSKWPYVHLAFLQYDHTTVKNIYEEEVTESQVIGRSLMKGFTVAAAQAQALFGKNVSVLPEPVVVPVVQTDSKMFHFSVFQLNTLELDSNSECKNIFWDSPRIPLYQTCEYQSGRPTFTEYNPDVIKRLCVFYNMANMMKSSS